MPNPSSWFAGRTTYRNSAIVEDGLAKTVFEERIILVWAREFEEASAKVRAEAQQYLQSDPNLELVECTVIYCTQEQEISEGAEVWSLLRECDMPASDYIRHYHSNERESVLVCKA
jgi:hypothetical protein